MENKVSRRECFARGMCVTRHAYQIRSKASLYKVFVNMIKRRHGGIKERVREKWGIA